MCVDLTITHKYQKSDFFILVLVFVMVLVLACYLVIVLVDFRAQNNYLKQIVVRIETIDLSKALASVVFVA